MHLLPTFDIATIEEDRPKQQQPACDLPSFAPDSEQQQDCVAAVAEPRTASTGATTRCHYTAPEGSYASDPKADGGARIAEFRTMVGGAAPAPACGWSWTWSTTTRRPPARRDKSVLDQIVPGYYQRLDADGAVETSTCCQNTATEHAMMGRS